MACVQAQQQDDQMQQHVREVTSLLQDDRECVSVTRLATRLHISRTKASQVLSQVLEEQQERVTRNQSGPALASPTYITSSTLTRRGCESTQGTCDPPPEGGDVVPCTVFSFSASSIQEKESSSYINNRFLYALVPMEEEEAKMDPDTSRSHQLQQLTSMHEQTLAVWRDMIRDRDTEQLQASVEAVQDIIGLDEATTKEEWQARWTKYQQPSTELGAKAVSQMAGTSRSLKMRKKRAVTASSFFGGSSSNKTTSSTKTSSSTTSLSNRGATATMVSKTSQTKKQGPFSKSGSKKKAGMAEKENKLQPSNGSSVKVGTADDFVGDIDDEDEEDDMGKCYDSNMDVTKPLEQVPMVVEKQGPRPTLENGVSNDAEVAGESNRQSENDLMEMEAPPAAQKASTGERRKPRRKKLVKTTYRDTNGYLRSEMKEVWEEIPSDEEDDKSAVKLKQTRPLPHKQPPSKKKKPAAGKPSKLKQGSLSAFFKK